jgi:cell division protein FtsQ
MIPGKSKRKKPIKLFVMNAKVLKKRKKPPNFSPFTREKATRLGFVVVVFATCGFGGVEVSRYLLSDPKLAVKHIIVRGNQRLSEEEIIKRSLLEKGENIYRARIHRARDRLSKLALVKHVSVCRFMPDIIVIEVAERFAQARLPGSKKLLADYSGVVLSGSSCREPEELPLIVGVETSHLGVGDRCTEPAVRKALRVLRLCESPQLSGLVEVETIDSSKPDDLRLYLKQGRYTKRGCGVRIGGNDFEQRLANLAVILRQGLKQHGKKVQWVDVVLNYVRF